VRRRRSWTPSSNMVPAGARHLSASAEVEAPGLTCLPTLSPVMDLKIAGRQVPATSVNSRPRAPHLLQRISAGEQRHHWNACDFRQRTAR
jgi:hypothetical protein